MVRNYQVKNGPDKVGHHLPDNRPTYRAVEQTRGKLLDRLPRHLATDYS